MILTLFASVLFTFTKEWTFDGPYSVISETLLLCYSWCDNRWECRSLQFCTCHVFLILFSLSLYKHREAEQQSHMATRLGNGMSSPLSWKFSVSAISTCGSLLHLTLGECGKWKWRSLQLCPTLCDPIDSTPPGSPVPGFLQVRTLEWVAISFSNAWK